MGGSGSNLATTNPALRTVVQERIERLRAADPSNTLPIPIDLVTASASGLDPHISPAAARYQAARIARERGLPIERVEALIYEQTVKPALGFLGQPTVHVLRLNRSLDAAKS
jgi:K+-transporting ATPase ATPase C chain